MNIVYSILIIIVALWGIFYGFWRGITGQLASLLGFAFGAVSARIFTPIFAVNYESFVAKFCNPHYVSFMANLLCACCIYFVVYWIFCIFSKLLKGAMSVFEIGMLNRIIGAFFSLICSMLWLSIAFNLLLSIYPDSGLMRYEKSDDGNMVAGVMALTPAILGCYGADDFAHINQLREAKTISCNFNSPNNVIFKGNSAFKFNFVNAPLEYSLLWHKYIENN